MIRAALILLIAALSVTTPGCDVNPFDQAQVPIVSVDTSPGEAPVISWTPAGAAVVRIYRGTEAGDGYTSDFVWEVGSTAEGKNGMRGPVTYGVVPANAAEPFPAPELVAGEPYTVWVFRDDPEGEGSGFSNTNNTYTGTATFVP